MEWRNLCVECSSSGLITACELHMSSQLAVMSNNNIQDKLRTLGPQLCQIANKNVGDSLSEIDLLLVENFDCEYKEQNIVTFSQRKAKV